MLRLFVCLVVILAGSVSHAGSTVKVGAKVLHDSGYEAIDGKRVGLITNHSAMVGHDHLIDLMHASGKVRLAVIFAPEHGLRGLMEDGVQISSGADARTGIPLFSLYGNVRKPTPEMLRGLDLLLFDIQDIGVRFYTYISSMGLAMQAAAAAQIPFVILDRPNPLGGEYLSGPLLEPPFGSFTGAYPIPVTHGMTVGELATMIKGERMLPGLEGLDLRVIRMKGWHRVMKWPETGLEWVRTSPNIPDFDTALLYPGICFFEGTGASEGRGTLEPFSLIGHPGMDAAAISGQLNDEALPGVRFEPVLFTPKCIPGMSSDPKFRDREIPGVRLLITDVRDFRPVETGIHLVTALYDMLSEDEQKTFFRRPGFDCLAGTASLRQSIEAGEETAEIIAAWSTGIEYFREQRRKYLLY